MTYCIQKSICDSPLSLFQNVHQIPIFANHEDNENVQDNENHPGNEKEGN